MRICFVTPEFVTEWNYCGGLANYVGRCSSGLAKLGHEVHVITRGERTETIPFNGVQLHRVRPVWDERMILDHVDPLIPRRLYNPYQDVKAAYCYWKRWRGLRQKTKFDVIQVSNVNASGLFFKSEKAVPVITRMSSHRPIFDQMAGLPVDIGARARWALERKAIERTRFVFAPSNFLAEITRREYRIAEVAVIRSPFFLDVPDLDFTAWQQQARGHRYALYFGRLTQMKGAHLFAEAMPIVCRECPDFRLLLIGADSLAPKGPSMKRFLETQLATYAERIQILEPLRHPQLYPFIQHSQFVILPSLVDNFPNSCLEAMGFGKAVISTRGSSLEEMVDHESNGLLVRAGNAEELAAAMIRMWRADPVQINRMEAAARKAVARFAPEKVLPALLDYYQEVRQRFQA